MRQSYVSNISSRAEVAAERKQLQPEAGKEVLLAGDQVIVGLFLDDGTGSHPRGLRRRYVISFDTFQLFCRVYSLLCYKC